MRSLEPSQAGTAMNRSDTPIPERTRARISRRSQQQFHNTTTLGAGQFTTPRQPLVRATTATASSFTLLKFRPVHLFRFDGIYAGLGIYGTGARLRSALVLGGAVALMPGCSVLAQRNAEKPQGTHYSAAFIKAGKLVIFPFDRAEITADLPSALNGNTFSAERAQDLRIRRVAGGRIGGPHYRGNDRDRRA